MGEILTKAADVYRDFVVPGVPATGPNEPRKSEIRTWAGTIDNAVTQLAAAFVADAATLIYAAQSSLFANLAPADRSIGIVYNDTPAKNGIYIKNGAAGSGSWNATGLLLAGPRGEAATISVGTVSNGSAVSVVNRGTANNAIFDFVLQAGKSFYQSALDTGYIPAGTTEQQFIARISTDITAAATVRAKAEADRAEQASQLSVAASLSIPGVFATVTEGLAAVAEGQTFWAAPDGDPTLYRKVAGQADRIISLSDLGQSRSTIKLSRLTPADGKTVPLVNVTAGSAVIVAEDEESQIFAAGDVGKRIRVGRAGPGGSDLFTTVASYQSPAQITLADVAVSSVSVAGAQLGTDCGPALQTALDLIFALRGGTILIDGLFYWETPVDRNFTQTVGASLEITGVGQSTGLLVAGTAVKDMMTLQNCPNLYIHGVYFSGCNGAFNDCRRLLNLQTCEYIYERNGFFGLSVLNAVDGAVIRSRRCRHRSYDNEFGGCIAQSGAFTNVVDVDEFGLFDSKRDRYLDYGTFQNTLFSKTGFDFAFAWVRVKSPYLPLAVVNGGSVVRIEDMQFDEGHLRGLVIGPDLPEQTNIPQVHLRGIRANNSLLDGGTSIVIANCTDVKIEQTSIGWCSLIRTGMNIDRCKNVTIDGVYITAGRPDDAGEGTADGLVVTNVETLTLKDAGAFKRRFFDNVGKVIEIEGGVGGVVPFAKAGRITDADFKSPPPNNTIAIDTLSKRLYVKVGGDWLATAGLVETEDPMFTLNNVTPATGELLSASEYRKKAGTLTFGECTANLVSTVVGGFRMRIGFGDNTPDTYVRAGAVGADVAGPDYIMQSDALALGLLQNVGTEIYVVSLDALIAGPFAYAPDQECVLTYDSGTGQYSLSVNGVQVVAPTAAPAAMTASTEHRFSSSIANVGGRFELFEYGPL